MSDTKPLLGGSRESGGGDESSSSASASSSSPASTSSPPAPAPSSVAISIEPPPEYAEHAAAAEMLSHVAASSQWPGGALVAAVAGGEHFERVARLLGAASTLGARAINAADSARWTALHHAVHLGRGDVVRLLLRAGVDANVPDVDGRTPLFLACERGDVDLLRQLSASHVNARAHSGRTPLHYAVLQENVEVVRHLLAAGADYGIADSENETPLQLALRSRNIALVSEFVQHTARLHDAGNDVPTVVKASDARVRNVAAKLLARTTTVTPSTTTTTAGDSNCGPVAPDDVLAALEHEERTLAEAVAFCSRCSRIFAVTLLVALLSTFLFARLQTILMGEAEAD